MSLSEFIDRLWRWPWSLIPRRVDHETLVISDIIAGIQVAALAACLVDGPWAIFAGPISMIALFLQLLISLGIFVVKLLAARPSVGHFAMYAAPQPVRDASWPRAMRGFLISIVAFTASVGISYARSAP